MQNSLGSSRLAVVDRQGLARTQAVSGSRFWGESPQPLRAVAAVEPQAVRKAGVRDGVVLLDEVDKMGRDARGDPGAALLEARRRRRPSASHQLSPSHSL